MKTEPGKKITGPFGDAQEVIATMDDSDPPDAHGTISIWIIDAPGQSPAWRHYILSIVHLRDIEGATPIVHHVPGSTHQVFLFAIDPKQKPDPLDVSTWRHMTPGNVCEEVILPDDPTAVTLLEHCAQAVVEGVLPAEPPLAISASSLELRHHREPWRTVLIKTSAHLRGEEHAP